MQRFASGHGVAQDWRDAVGACLDQLDEGLDGTETLGFVYISDHLAVHATDILTILRGRTGVNDWVGTTGIGIAAGGREFFDEPAISAMVTDTARDHFQLFQGQDAVTTNPWFGIMHGNPQAEDLPVQIRDTAEQTGGFWVGGIAASRGAYPVIARQLVTAPVSGVAFSDQVEVLTALSQGCTPIGPTFEITRAEENLIIDLDGRPAFEVFREQIGELLARNLERIPGFIFAGLPVPGADNDDYMIRDIVGLDPGQGLVAIAAEAEIGARVMFCRRDGATAQADMTSMLDKLEKRLAGRTPRGGVYFSCLGRGSNMFDEQNRETAMIAERFDDVPLTGFFCNGEISNARLYTYTGVLTLFV